jgi:hypothetical protein
MISLGILATGEDQYLFNLPSSSPLARMCTLARMCNLTRMYPKGKLKMIDDKWGFKFISEESHLITNDH